MTVTWEEIGDRQVMEELRVARDLPETIDPVTTLGEAIAARREELGLSQQACASKLNVAIRTWSNWERDATEPRGHDRARIGLVLGGDLRKHGDGWVFVRRDGEPEPVDPIIDLPPNLVAGLTPEDVDYIKAVALARAWEAAREVRRGK